MNPSDPRQEGEAFVRLFARYEQDLRRFIFSLVLDRDAADEVFQNTSVALWRKFADFDPAQPFLPWALAFAKLEVLKHRKKGRRGRFVMGDGLIDRLADERAAEADELDTRRRALRDCLAKLPDEQRSLVRRRYASSETVAALAQQVGRTPKQLYKTLERVRAALMNCVNRAVTDGGAA